MIFSWIKEEEEEHKCKNVHATFYTGKLYNIYERIYYEAKSFIVPEF